MSPSIDDVDFRGLYPSNAAGQRPCSWLLEEEMRQAGVPQSLDSQILLQEVVGTSSLSSALFRVRRSRESHRFHSSVSLGRENESTYADG